MNFIPTAIIWFVLTSGVTSLDDVDYVRVGCYKDEMPYRALPEILANYRRVKNAKSPDVLDWNDLENSVIKRCAVKAKAKGYSFFGIQFYGECWSGPKSEKTYSKYDLSSECTTTAPFVGKENANFVYMLTTENECTDYKVLDDADRSQFHITDTKKTVRCDKERVGDSWYRFVGAAGNAMADKCVKPGRCQTFSTGWYSGSYPKVAEGIQSGTVCFSWIKDCCKKNWNVTIGIRNCSSFFVYKLKKDIGCTRAYCGIGQ